MLVYELTCALRRRASAPRRGLRERNAGTALSLIILMLALYAGTIVLHLFTAG